MKRQKRKQRVNLIILLIVYLIFALTYIKVSLASTEITPEDNQYLELRASTINEVEGQPKQVIMELWGHEIDFKRI